MLEDREKLKSIVLGEEDPSNAVDRSSRKETNRIASLIREAADRVKWTHYMLGQTMKETSEDDGIS